MREKFIVYIDELIADIDCRLESIENSEKQMSVELDTIKKELIVVRTNVEANNYNIGESIAYGYYITDHWSLDDILGSKLLRLKQAIIKYNKNKSLKLTLK